jgi:PEP-CTERM motif
MKKTILTTLCALAVAGGAFAQGNVNWGSISFTYMTAQTNSTTYSPYFGGGSAVGGATGAAGGNASAGTGFYYELLVGPQWTGGTTNNVPPSTLTAFSSWTDTGLEATNSNTAGRLTVVQGNNGATVNSLSPGTTNYIMLVGWSANLGTTWSGAYAHLQSSSYIAGLSGNAYFGISNLGWITPLSSSTSPGSVVFGLPIGGQQPIQSVNTQLYLVGATPEPGTMALAALGGASLLLFRRRK